ncbi:TerD family protein [Vibrio parahaemolyticus]|uniref:TerD family protein n=1 Tax=Vibrio parahaemolyticus TaxID=670 RepID=UPI0006C63D03|nr:hypothetical protein ACX10_15515 [Vibrio parahaemolyticus]
MKTHVQTENQDNSNFQHLQSIMLSKRSAYFLKSESSSNPVSAEIAKEIFDEIDTEMLRLGYVMSAQLKLALKQLSEESLLEEAKSLIYALSEAKGDLNNFVTLHANFPYTAQDRSYHDNRAGVIFSHVFGFKAKPTSIQVKLPCGCSFDDQLFDLSMFNACPVCQHQVAGLSDNVEGERQGTVEFSLNDNIVKLSNVGLASKDDLFDVFGNLLASSTSITAFDKEFVKQVIIAFKEEALEHVPGSMAHKEQLCFLTGVISEHLPDAIGIMRSKFKTYTDVLRLAAYLSGFDVSLEACKKIKFKLSRKQRKLIMTLLDRNMLMEDMIRRRGLFLALGRYLHVGSEATKYPHAAHAFNVLRNDHKSIKTFNSKKEALLMDAMGVQQTPKGTIPKKDVEIHLHNTSLKVTIGDAVGDKTLKTLLAMCSEKHESDKSSEKLATDLKERGEAFTGLVSLLSSRPGEFARNIDLMLRIGDSLGDDYTEIVINALEKSVVHELKISQLFQLRTYFNSRVVNEGYRYFIPKGNRAKLFYLEEDKRDSLSQSNANKVSLCLLAEINKRLSQKESLGTVYIDPALKNIVLPLSMRSMASSLSLYPRGSRIPLEKDADILRMFMYWKGEVDFDLSAKALDESWNTMKDIGYWTYWNCEPADTYSDWNQDEWARFSGDIQDAPLGAAECIDINIKKCSDMGIRYVVMFVNIFSGGKFEDYNAFVGVMERKDAKVGELFEPSSVSQKLDLVGESKGCVPLILDVLDMSYFVCDMDSSTRADGLNSSTESKKMINIAKSTEAMSRTNPTMYDLALANAVARGQRVTLVDKPIEEIVNDEVVKHEIDFRFDMDFAMQLDTVMGKWLVD